MHVFGVFPLNTAKLFWQYTFHYKTIILMSRNTCQGVDFSRRVSKGEAVCAAPRLVLQPLAHRRMASVNH